MPKVVPPRLHVLFARDSRAAVVIRRGPSRKVAIIGWDRETDTFHVGQWLYGRIYERRCDLSPDGQHLVYFAMNGKWQSEVLGSWTAVSRAPYVKAVGLWPKGDCWNGGGLFISNDRFWLNDGPFVHQTMYEAPGLKHQSKNPWPGSYGGECPGVYYVRLQRDEKTQDVIAYPAWEWAEVDGPRIVWAADGALFTGRLERKGITKVKQLFDANSVNYEQTLAGIPGNGNYEEL